jgi:acyl-CoA hydrolase
MDHHKLVLPEYMNAQGSLFGGYLLKWLDEFAYITANVEFPAHRFVTIAMNNVEFRHPIACGQILRFAVERVRLGSTSVEYQVEVLDEGQSDGSGTVLFATNITFVNVGGQGEKLAIRQ